MSSSNWKRVIDRGTYHVSVDQFKQKIVDFNMLSKRDNNVGLQIADLCAYPIARHILNSEEPYVPFKIIENKFSKGSDGKIEEFGLKVFP